MRKIPRLWVKVWYSLGDAWSTATEIASYNRISLHATQVALSALVVRKVVDADIIQGQLQYRRHDPYVEAPEEIKERRKSVADRVAVRAPSQPTLEWPQELRQRKQTLEYERERCTTLYVYGTKEVTRIERKKIA